MDSSPTIGRPQIKRATIGAVLTEEMLMADAVPCRCTGDCGHHPGHCGALVGQPFDPKHLVKTGWEPWFTTGLCTVCWTAIQPKK